MIMSNDLMATYPRGTKLLQNLESSLKADKPVFDAWLKACMSEVQRKSPKVARKIALEKALRWASGPAIVVREGLITIKGTAAEHGACGFQPAFMGPGHILLITSVWFDAYEYCLTDSDRKKNARRLTTTVLHEAVHWVRQEAEAYDDIEDDDHIPQDAGSMFERWAFGKMNCNLEEITDALASISPSGVRLMQARRKKSGG
jgi:hypothetical protein